MKVRTSKQLIKWKAVLKMIYIAPCLYLKTQFEKKKDLPSVLDSTPHA